jgi:hypothetical protein
MSSDNSMPQCADCELGVSKGWQEASDYVLMEASRKFFAGQDKEAIALRNMAERLRDMSQKILVNIEEKETP